MMRSLYSGVAGLKTHQTKMDVIGNNIANVNTTAFKSSSISFTDLMSQTTQKASGANATTGTGGVNAKQIGLGVKSGAIKMNIDGQGSSQSTGNPFDIMITGDNFFVVNDGRSNYFTRDGSFYVDGAGNLAMTSTGYNVMGWQVDEETGAIKKDSVSALRIMSTANMTYPPEASSKAYASGILDKNDTDVTSSAGKVMNLNIYDNLGYQYTCRFVLKQSNDVNNYTVELDSILDSQGNKLDLSGAATALFGNANQTQEITTSIDFDSTNWAIAGTTLTNNATGDSYDLTKIDEDSADGEAVRKAIAKAYGQEGSEENFLNLYQVDGSGNITTVRSMVANGSIPTTTFECQGRYYEGTSISFNPGTGEFAMIGGLATATSTMLNLSQIGANFKDIEVDFKEVSMFDNSGTSTIGATSGDKDGIGSGRKLGDMIGVSVQQNGMIYASYDNGMTKLLGQIATANFANASGLEKQGDNLYAATLNSGEFDGIGVDITASGGYMSTGQLEMSNVDLSAEFTEMIVTQRGFQANSRIITVSDTLLEELTNLKR